MTLIFLVSLPTTVLPIGIRPTVPQMYCIQAIASLGKKAVIMYDLLKMKLFFYTI